MYEMLKELILHFKNIFFKKRTHPCSAKFCCLQEVEHGPLVLLHYYYLSVFKLLYCLSLTVLDIAMLPP